MINQKPEISRVTSFKGDSCLQIYGEGFEKNSKVYLWYSNIDYTEDKYFAKPPETPPTEARVFNIDKLLKQVIYVNNNNNIGAGVQVIWVENSLGFSKPFIANKPRIFNQSLLKACPNDVLTLYGDDFGEKIKGKRCLLINKETNNSYILKVLTHSDGVQYPWSRENYVAEFLIPEDIEFGNYDVYITSGSGGALGWSEPTELSIVKEDNSVVNYFRMQWNDTAFKSRKLNKDTEIIVINPAVTPFTDMTDKIQNAIDSLENGGIVKLMAGSYEISKTIEMKPGVVLLGEGNKLTIVKTSVINGITQDWSNVEYAKLPSEGSGYANDWRQFHMKYNPASLVRLRSNSGVKDIGFQMGNGANVGILIASESQEPVRGAFVMNCIADSMYHKVFEVAEGGFGAFCAGIFCACNTEELVIYNNELHAVSPIMFLPAKNNRIKLIRNIVDCSPAQENESFLCGAYYGIIMGNVFSNGRRALMSQNGFEGNFVYQNRVFGVSRAENSCETYMSEYGDTVLYGKAKEINDSYIVINAKMNEKIHGPKNLHDYRKVYPLYACIMDGRGFGQYRAIKECIDDKLYLEKPFDVKPDSTTVFSVCASTAKNLWINNNTEMSKSSSQFIWGCGIDNVVASHEIRNAFGVQIFARYGKNNGQACFCCYNKIEKCLVSSEGSGLLLRSETGNGEFEKDDPEGNFYLRTKGVFGNAIKNNVFATSKMPVFNPKNECLQDGRYQAGLEIYGGYNTFENNKLSGYRNAVSLISDCEGNYFARNYYPETNRFVGKKTAIGPDTK